MRIFKRKSTKSTTWCYDIRHEKLPKGRERKSGFKSKAEATQTAIQRMSELENDATIKKDVVAHEFIEEWIETYKLPFISHSGEKQFKVALEVFKKHFGNTLLKEVSRYEYQKMLNQYGADKAYRTVAILHNRLSEVLKAALYDDLIAKDPTYRIEINATVKAQRNKDKYINSTDYLKLIEKLKHQNEIEYLPIFIIAITGSRVHEVMDLTYDDIKYLDRIRLPGTKSENADRIVAISPQNMQLIKEKLNKYPRNYNNKLFNFSTSTSRRRLKNVLESIGLKEDRITLRGLRHTHISYLAQKGLSDDYISERVGHSNVMITKAVYTHMFEEQKRAEEEKLKQLFL